MLFNYCPDCAAVGFGSVEDAKCKCGYNGPLNSGTMDEINSYKIRLNAGMSRKQPSKEYGAGTAPDTKKKMNTLKGIKSDDFEIL
ncbi:MAG TPA: hypothetical protein VFF13_03220 [archaeon]|nr:hypothetical protein [archaeon]